MEFWMHHDSERRPHPCRTPEFNYLKLKSSRNSCSIQIEWMCRSSEHSLFLPKLLKSDAEGLVREFKSKAVETIAIILLSKQTKKQTNKNGFLVCWKKVSHSFFTNWLHFQCRALNTSQINFFFLCTFSLSVQKAERTDHRSVIRHDSWLKCPFHTAINRLISFHREKMLF